MVRSNTEAKQTDLERALDHFKEALGWMHQHNVAIALEGYRDADTTDIEQTWLGQLTTISGKLKGGKITGRADKYVVDLSEYLDDD